MKSDSVKVYGSLFIMLLLFSCKKLIEIGPPKTEIITGKVFTSNDKATSAITVIYAQMVNRDNITYRLPWMTGLSGDELKNYGTLTNYIELYQNALTIDNSQILSSIWTPFYNYIYEANAALEGLVASNDINPAVKAQLIGEAKFIRAFCHFYLLNFFGNIPIVTGTDYAVNQLASRSDESLVYGQIINDLKDAQTLLSDNFVDATSLVATAERIRPNKAVATALLSRVYLYTEDYENAEVQATALINDGRFLIVDDLDKVFLKGSPEAIWALPPVNYGFITKEADGFILNTAPSSSLATKNSDLSTQLLNAFEIGDRRKSNWINSVSTFYFPYKYKVETSQTSATEYSIVFRLAEQYLIRAESRAQQEKLFGLNSAESDLNLIRERADLLPTAATTKKEMLAAIFRERQVELFTEWGHRWFDLKRTNSINEVMAPVTSMKGGTWKKEWAWYPIPRTERNNAPNLSQNEGYDY